MQRKLIFGAVIVGVAALALLLLRPSGEEASTTDANDAGERPPERRHSTAHEENRAAQARAIEAEDALGRERFAASVKITSPGEVPTTLTSDALRDAFDSDQLQFHQCVLAAGGYDAMRTAFRAARRTEEEGSPEEGERPAFLPQRTAESVLPSRSPTGMTEPSGTAEGGPIRMRVNGRTATFDVRPDGTVDPASVVFTPPVPAPFEACFAGHVTRLHLSNVGANGAHVEVPMPGPRRPLPPTTTGAPDGGV